MHLIMEHFGSDRKHMMYAAYYLFKTWKVQEPHLFWMKKFKPVPFFLILKIYIPFILMSVYQMDFIW